MSGTALRALIDAPEIVVAPGVYDALSALIAARAGFAALYLSGASIACTRYGRPDLGLVDAGEIERIVAAVKERADRPLIVDADTGYGNALNVMQTVRRFARAGADAIQIEDQAEPKRCGHLDEKRVIPAAEMAGKIKAACDARPGRDVLIVARTDAVAVEGFAAALDRADSYRDAGADVLFIEALRTEDEIAVVTRRFRGRAPLLVNMVEGGRTPFKSARELEALGFAIAIFPGGAVRFLGRALDGYYASLQQHGTTAPYRDRMLDFDSLNALIGTPEMLALGKRYHGER